MSTKNFSGTWLSTHWYPSKDDSDVESCAHEVRAEQTGKQLILQSLTDPARSYLIMRLVINGVSASGSWSEHTTPGGEYDNIEYSGQLALLVKDNGTEMRGKWVGVGHNHATNKPDIYTGRWELTRID